MAERPSEFMKGLALKVWMMNYGQDLAQGCVRDGPQNAPAEAVRTSAASAFALFIFNPDLQLSDLVSNFDSGGFKEFNVTSDEVSRLSHESSPTKLSP